MVILFNLKFVSHKIIKISFQIYFRIMSMIWRCFLNISSISPVSFLESHKIWIVFPITIYFLSHSFPLSRPIAIILYWLSLICLHLIGHQHSNITYKYLTFLHIFQSLYQDESDSDFKLSPDLDNSLPV